MTELDAPSENLELSVIILFPSANKKYLNVLIIECKLKEISLEQTGLYDGRIGIPLFNCIYPVRIMNWLTRARSLLRRKFELERLMGRRWEYDAHGTLVDFFSLYLPESRIVL